MSDDLCAFCLGDREEIPPFGTAKDAEDFIKPCGTCSLVAHRKCLIDWFNTIPAAKLSYANYDENDNENDNDNATEYNIDESENITVNEDEHGNEYANDDVNDYENNTAANNGIGMNGANDTNIINVTFQTPWMSAVGLFLRDLDYHVHEALSDSRTVLLLTECPQCKSTITFCMTRLGFLGINSLVRTSIADLVQYGAVFMGLTGAATGIVTTAYVGLARCGVNMFDALVPAPLLVPLVARKLGIDRATLADQLRFQHVPLLPVMLWRMRQLLVLDCFFAPNARAALSNVAGELLVSNYISSLGSHVLVRRVARNVAQWAAHLWHTRSLGALSALTWRTLTAGVDWWDPSVMVGALVPARWVYDVMFRMTVNRMHFDLTARIRPRDVANAMGDVELTRLENLNAESARLATVWHKKVQSKGPISGMLARLRLVTDQTWWRYIQVRAMAAWHKWTACLRTDFLRTLLVNLAVVTGVTTVVWPFIAADAGRVLYRLVLLRMRAFDGVDADKVMLLANLVGMAVVALAKDMYNFAISSRKARQLSDLSIVYAPRPAPRRPQPLPRFPGAFQEN